LGYSPRAKPMLKPNTIPHPRNRRARSAQSPPSFVLRFSPCAPGLRGKSILFIRLRTLCRRQKSHLLWNQQLPDSFAKTPGWGYPARFDVRTFKKLRHPDGDSPVLCFHTLTNCFSRLSTGRLAGKPFGFIAPEGLFPFRLFTSHRSQVTSHAFSSACRLFFSLCPLLQARSLCFQRFAASFAKTPGGGGGATQFRSSAVPHLRYPLPTTHYPLSLLTPQLAWSRQAQEYQCE